MTTLRDTWRDGGTTLGAWLALPGSVPAEAMARRGFDYCCVDAQHGLCEYSDAVGMVQAIVLGGSRPLVRVPWNEPGIIGKMLDLGAEGVIVPMVNTAADARAAVAACRYPPGGSRSYGPSLAALRVEGDYVEWARDNVACIVMVETAEAVENVDAIVEVPGVDAVYVGPSDLSLSLGLAVGNPDDVDSFASAIDRVLAACERTGVVPGAHGAASQEVAARRLAQGFRLVTVTTDQSSMARAAAADLRAARDVRP